MTEEEVKNILESLRTGEKVGEMIQKDNFLLFRNILMQQQDKARFIGRAKKGGKVLYTYQRMDDEKGGEN